MMVDALPVEEITPGVSVNFGTGYDQRPIEWLVVSVEERRGLLLARHPLRAPDGSYLTVAFSADTGLWRDSEICQWLNGNKPGSFLHDGFSAAERRAIAKTGYLTLKAGSQAASEDPHQAELSQVAFSSKIFLASAELMRSSEVATRVLGPDAEGPGWWLRDLGRHRNQALCVSQRGRWLILSHDVHDPLTIRPALWLRLP